MILVIDDNPADCYSLARILRAKGFKVLEAHDRVTALQMAEREKIRAVFVDVFLGKDDGFAVSQELAAMPTASRALVVLMSGRFRHSDDPHAVLNSGASAYLDKPFDSNEIDQLLRDNHVAPI